MLRLYDTRRRGVHPFRAKADTVAMYVCGITPYDTTHLGHARTFLVFDVLARLLEVRGKRVRYVQNVTDIDESILQRAASDGVDWRELGKREERAFLSDMERLGWRKPDVLPHATREIAAMKRLVATLRERGVAYVLEGGVYFDVSRDPHYGELSHLSRAKMAKIASEQDDAALDDAGRRDPVDFALWRRVRSGPTWPGRAGPGRPGWHLECSAMSLRYLGPRVDIHGGGTDLIYPHHENEVAQSEAATGVRPVVRHWMHVAPMRLDGEKMSKSKRNMVFVRDALDRVTPEGLRLYVLDAHYRRPMDHDEGRMQRADERSEALAAALGEGRVGPIGRDAASRAVLDALDDDLDTPNAIRVLERGARGAKEERTRASLRAVAQVLGVAGVAPKAIPRTRRK